MAGGAAPKAGGAAPKAGGDAPANAGGGAPANAAGEPGDGAPPAGEGAGEPPAAGTPPATQGDAPSNSSGGIPPAPEDALGGFVPTAKDLPKFAKVLKDGDATVTLTFEISGATNGQIDISVADAEEPQVVHIEMFSGTSTVTIKAPAKSSQSLQASVTAFDEDGKMVGMAKPVPVKLEGEDASFSLVVEESEGLEMPAE